MSNSNLAQEKAKNESEKKTGFYESICEKLDSLQPGEPDLFRFYIALWEGGVLLNGDQYAKILQRLEKVRNLSPRTRCWYILSEGFFYTFFPKFGNAFEKLTESIEAFREIGDQHGEGAAESLITLYYKNIGQLARAQEFVQNAILHINEDRNYIYFIGISYYQAGEIHHLLKDYKAAISYFTKGHSYGIGGAGINARLLGALGTVHLDTNELELALDYFQKALKQIEGKNNYLLESKLYADIGNYYNRKGDFDQSLFFHRKSLKMREDNKLLNPVITNYIELAELFLKKGDLDQALDYAVLAEKLSAELNVVIKLYQALFITSTIYEARGEPAAALEYYKKYHKIKDDVLSQESARTIKQLNMQHEMESMQQEKEIFKLKNVVLKNALEEIEASVRYAQRIQEAILPQVGSIKAIFPESFVFYQPKDIVAGDFYWMEEIDDTVLIAVADCTGHGVPGAIVSVICSNALNRAVKEFRLSDTAQVLDKVTALVIESFEKSSADVKDGMDISLLSINRSGQKIQWSGANNPLWYITNGEFSEVTPDKQPIGKSDHGKPFTAHTLQYKTGTVFYLFTDGYADQFGGPHGKKFKYAQFKQTLAQSVNEGVSAQEPVLKKRLAGWKGNLEQVDDVCIIGLRL